MKNVTLSAKEDLIQRARELAKERHTTLNQMFRDWLQSLDSGSNRRNAYRSLMSQMEQIGISGSPKFSREEMNER